MEYVESAPFFHIFEGEEYIVAFNFASQQEAKVFKGVIDQKVLMKKRKEEKRARQLAQSQSMRLPNQKNLDFGSKQELRKEKRRRNITKADIGTPMGFVHISHVGWNPNTGFDVLSEDAQLKSLFQKAGVSEKQLQDKETREFIYDFLHRFGGINTPLEGERDPPAVPPRGPPKPPSARPAPPPPPVVTRMPSQENYSVATKKSRPPSPPKQTMGGGGGTAPPPPPPPPPMNVPVPPPMMDSEAMALPAPAQKGPDGYTALMQSIRTGTTLKSVEDRSPAPVDDARGDLLSEIRKGIQLKPVDEREIKPAEVASPQKTGNDLAGALRKALAERSNVLHSEDDDDDTSSTSNDEDWD